MPHTRGVSLQYFIRSTHKKGLITNRVDDEHPLDNTAEYVFSRDGLPSEDSSFPSSEPGEEEDDEEEEVPSADPLDEKFVERVPAARLDLPLVLLPTTPRATYPSR